MKTSTHPRKARIHKLRANGFKATEIARFTGCPLADVRELLYGSRTRKKNNQLRRELKAMAGGH